MKPRKYTIGRITAFFALLFLSTLISAATVVAQTGTLSGVVRDAATGEPLPGANILVTGTQLGTATEIDGSYRLNVPAGSQQVRVAFLGYQTARQAVTVQTGTSLTLNFSLEPDLIGADDVVVLGTRTSERTVISSAVPIDIITAGEIQQTGYTQTAQIIQLLVPSFNTAHSSVTDGTDHLRPATLRGLGPDQVLVLVNGKRRHTGSLVHVNGSIGRGSTGVDLNAIPVNTIERIEVLRDGAAAQYGSDAISGVINIVLRRSPGLDASLTYGQFYSTVDRGFDLGEELHTLADGTAAPDGAFAGNKESVTYTDGQSINLHLGYGVELPRGNLYVSGQYRDRGHTNRAGLDFVDAPAEGIDRWRYGGGELTDFSLFLNANHAVGETAEAYLFSGYSSREGASTGFYRRPNAANNIPNVYPEGFLPRIGSNITDFSIAGGVRGQLGRFSYDISETFGFNEFDFSVFNSGNVSLVDPSLPASQARAATQTRFDTGAKSFTQATTNLDLQTNADIGTASPLSVAFGAEFRWEQFRQKAGEEASYVAGPFPGPAGAQVFPGFTPTDITTQSRSNVGLYLDLENNLTTRLLLGAAGRFENYSDFGSTITGKLAGRFELIDGLAVRAAVSSGFRAPSLAQSHFSKVATVFIDGTPFEIGTFPVSSPAALALGAEELKPETSLNISAGATYVRGNFSLTADVYQIDITDRIVLTENFTGAGIAQFLADRGVNANGGRFFTNAVNTSTRGIDIIARYGLRLGNGDRLRFTVAANFNETEITNKDDIETPAQLAAVTTTPLFGRVEQGRFETGQPSSKINTAINYTRNNLDVLLKLNRFGEVDVLSANPLLDRKYGAKWLTDLEVSYSITRNYRLAIGANNLFDVYPDRNWQATSNGGIFPYSGFSPFGFEGRYIYSRFTVRI